MGHTVQGPTADAIPPISHPKAIRANTACGGAVFLMAAV